MMLLLNSVQLCNHDAFIGNIRTPGTVNIGQEKYSCPDVAYLDNASIGQLHFPWWPHVSLLLNHSLSVRLCSKNFKSITLLSLYGTWWDSYYLPIPFSDGKLKHRAFKKLVKGYTASKCKSGFKPGSFVPEPIFIIYNSAISFFIYVRMFYLMTWAPPRLCVLWMRSHADIAYLSIPSVITMPGM